MNTMSFPGQRVEFRAWHAAAAALFVALCAYSETSAAQKRAPQAASVVPVAAPASAALPAALPATPSQQTSLVESIGAGDNVRITVFRNPDLTTETRVNERGAISFPLIGEVQLGGLTVQQASKRIADRLKSGGFVVNPEVTMSIAQVNSRQVSVLGNVNKPGRYPLEVTNARLLDVLALAGGVAPTGSDLVSIVSAKNGQKTDVDLPAMLRAGDLNKNVELAPGDTVFVHRAPMVYVYGEVQKAGAYRIEPHMTVMQAIAMGGGLTARGTERGVKIHRRNGDGSVKELSARLTDAVRDDDVIYVRESLF